MSPSSLSEAFIKCVYGSLYSKGKGRKRKKEKRPLDALNENEGLDESALRVIVSLVGLVA